LDIVQIIWAPLRKLFAPAGVPSWLRVWLQALGFLHAFEESVDCALLSSFCDDSNLNLSIFKWDTYSPQWGKQGMDQQIFNRKSISRKIMHPQSLFK